MFRLVVHYLDSVIVECYALRQMRVRSVSALSQLWRRTAVLWRKYAAFQHRTGGMRPEVGDRNQNIRLILKIKRELQELRSTDGV